MPSSALACGPARHLAFPASQVVILLPNLLQELHTGHLLQLGWGIGLLQRLQQMQPICSDLLCQGSSLAFGGWRKR
jgi:hypothetical protein